MDKKLINIQAPIEFIEKMKEYAKKHMITVSMLIRLAVSEYMKNHNDD